MTTLVDTWSALRPEVTPALLDEVARRIVDRFHPERIILFGSYAYGTPTIESDVDLLVVMESDKTLFPRIREVAEIAKVPYLPMDVIVRTPAEMKERLEMGDFFLRDIVDNGRILYERVL